MIKLDPSQFPSDITNILMLRGAGVPPLLWQERPNTSAKAMIDANADDAALFRGRKLVDESMCAAVRALLYLWNGWHAECEMYAQAAPEPERNYLSVFALRQSGSPKKAKELLMRIEDHPVYEPLSEFALETIAIGSDAALNRVRQIIELGKAWEPFAFVDLYEQARSSTDSDTRKRAVCAIQCGEFELLFAHCFEKATGEPVARQTEKATPRKHLPKPARKPTKPRPPSPPASGTKPSEPTKPRLIRKPAGVSVSCPKCGHICLAPEERRGKGHECPRCKAAFLVPAKKPAPAT